MSARATLIGAALILGSVCMTAPAGAQQATERYIPLGRSPGLSGTSTYIGRIASADSRTRTLDVVGPAGLPRGSSSRGQIPGSRGQEVGRVDQAAAG